MAEPNGNIAKVSGYGCTRACETDLELYKDALEAAKNNAAKKVCGVSYDQTSKFEIVGKPLLTTESKTKLCYSITARIVCDPNIEPETSEGEKSALSRKL